MLEPKVCRLRTSNLEGGWSMCYHMPWPAIKACEVARARGIPCRLHQAATQLVKSVSVSGELNTVRSLEFQEAASWEWISNVHQTS